MNICKFLVRVNNGKQVYVENIQNLLGLDSYYLKVSEEYISDHKDHFINHWYEKMQIRKDIPSWIMKSDKLEFEFIVD